MNKTRLHLNRRKFMALSSTTIVAPVLKGMAAKIPEAGAAKKQYDFIDQKNCDLVVLGGGGSGLVAAVRAAQLTGKKVVVLEKAQSTGGAAQFAGTNRTFGSKWQADRNLPDTTTAYARDMMKEKCKTYGVEVLTKHPVFDVEVKNGKIVAAVAKSETGHIRVACKACIMSIGSWINNEAVLKKCCPKFAGMKHYMDPMDATGTCRTSKLF